MGTIDRLVADLRNFDGRKEVAQALRKRIREPVPGVRAAIRRRAVAILPARGGLGAWAAKTRIGATFTVGARTARVRLRATRKSLYRPSDVSALDRGRVKHPRWGYRPAHIDDWPLQLVPRGYVTGPSTELDQWRAACLRAAEDALEVIRRG